MIVQTTISIILVIFEIVLCKFSFPLFIRLFSRIFFLLKFQGMKIAPVVLYIIEGIGITIAILIQFIFHKDAIEWWKLGIIVGVSLIHCAQVAIEDLMFIQVDLPKEKYEKLKEKGLK